MKAELIPHVELKDIETDSERAVALALLNSLQAPWVVIHSLPWLRKNRHFMEEGEADFVLLHPEHGLLVVEVKGGSIHYDSQHGRWFTNGKQLKKSPFEQARKNMHDLLNTIKERSPGMPPFTFGYAVVFPDCELSGNPPPGSDNHIQAGYSNMSKLGKHLTDALTAWGKRPPLNAHHFQELRRGLLSDFKIVYALQKDLETNEQLLVRLTEQQFSVLKGLDKNPRVTVEGAAGTGKTLMAVRRAEMFADRGLKTLFLCFNRNLMSDLAARLADTSIKVATFHGLCRELCKQATVPFDPPDGDSSKFWNDEAAELLSEALDELPNVRFDAVLVDEAQDFEPRWWHAVERLLKRKEGYLYIFFDRRQNLYNKTECFPACAARFDLTINCRNTRKIASTCGQIIASSVETSPFAPEGSATQVLVFKDRNDAKARAVKAVEFFATNMNIPLGRIACLSPYSPEKSSLAGGWVGNFRTTDKLEIWRSNQAVWLSSIKAFKGLEADALVLTDLPDFKVGVFDKADFYVACSRAKLLLVVLTSSDEVARCATEAKT